MRADGEMHAEHSLCWQQGLVVQAEVTDHIDGHSRPDDRATFRNEARLQSLCKRCNTVKAIKHEGGFGR
jgi:5-methylcytosine-specific restriction endonuclease McrA